MSSAAPAKKPYRKAPPEHRELRLEIPVSRLEQEESLTDAERMKLLQQENEELRKRLASATRRTEALERELEIGQDCLELELGQSREELDKFKDNSAGYRTATRHPSGPTRNWRTSCTH